VLGGTSCLACSSLYSACGVGGVGVECGVMCDVVLKVDWMRVINNALFSRDSCGSCGLVSTSYER
jgi:hypothetical protein